MAKTAKTVIEVTEKDLPMADIITKVSNNEQANIEEVAAVARVLEDQAKIYTDTAKILRSSVSSKSLKDIRASLVARGLIKDGDEGEIIVAVTPVTGGRFGIKIAEKEVTKLTLGETLKNASEETLKLLPKEMVRTETKLVTDATLIALVDAGKIPDVYKSEISVTRNKEITFNKAKI